MKKCPCGSELHYKNCCGQYIDGTLTPPTPVALMRSRYTAYTRANTDYIAKTMKSPAADDFDPYTARMWARQLDWKKLEVLNSSGDEHTGTVEFIAYFDNQTMHEISHFRCDDGIWYYVDGEQ